MTIEIVTDCTGIKQEAIRNVFSKRFSTDSLNVGLVKSKGFETPLTQDSFPLTVQKRFQCIKENIENPDVFIATIQKGYYCVNGVWFLTACVGVAYPLYSMLTAMTSSVPLPSICAKKKSLHLSMNMSDILKEQYPEWDKENGSVYTLLTNEEEAPWLEQPLRHCLNIVTKFQ